MDITQGVVLIVAVVGLFLTIGSFLYMARSDYRHLDAKIDSIRELTHAIHLEMKDFHNRLEKQDQAFKERLCVIEEKRRK